MRPFSSTISLEEARRRLDAAVRPILGTERVRLEDAAGRVAAADVVSAIDVPPFARSAMDGYAVVAADTESATRATPARLRLLDRIYTGQPSSIAIARGTCARLPPGRPRQRRRGGDGRETAAASGIDVRRVTTGQHIGRRGADIGPGSRAGARSLQPRRAGSRLSAAPMPRCSRSRASILDRQ